MCQCHVHRETQIWKFSTLQQQLWSVSISNSKRASLCRSRQMMLHCYALWETSPWTTSTTRKRGTCPRAAAPERRDHLHALHSGNNTGKRWGVSLVLLLITTRGDPLFPFSATQAPSGGSKMPTKKLYSHEVYPAVRLNSDFILFAYGKHMPANGTTHCICRMWDHLHALRECRSTGHENASNARQDLMLNIVAVP